MSVTTDSRISLIEIDQAIESLSKDHFAYTTRGMKPGTLICPFCSALDEGVIAEWPCHVAQLALAHESLVRVVRACKAFDAGGNDRALNDELIEALAAFTDGAS